MEESKMDRYLKDHLPGFWLKWVSPGETGVPDRILLLPPGVLVFAELKAEGGRLSARQKLWRSRLRDGGYDYRLIVGMAGAKAFVEEVEKRYGI